MISNDESLFIRYIGQNPDCDISIGELEDLNGLSLKAVKQLFKGLARKKLVTGTVASNGRLQLTKLGQKEFVKEMAHDAPAKPKAVVVDPTPEPEEPKTKRTRNSAKAYTWVVIDSDTAVKLRKVRKGKMRNASSVTVYGAITAEQKAELESYGKPVSYKTLEEM